MRAISELTDLEINELVTEFNREGRSYDDLKAISKKLSVSINHAYRYINQRYRENKYTDFYDLFPRNKQSTRIQSCLLRGGFTSNKEVASAIKIGRLKPGAIHNYGEKTHSEVVAALMNNGYLTATDFIALHNIEQFSNRNSVVADIRDLIESWNIEQNELFGEV